MWTTGVAGRACAPAGDVSLANHKSMLKHIMIYVMITSVILISER
jgi:hypothetical protein